MSTVATGSDEPKGSKPSGHLPTPKMRRGGKSYFAEVLREMKKVSWPTKSETNRLFGVVMMVTIMLVVVLSTLGWLFGLIIDYVTRGQI
ncbi:hypothetical protein BH11ARM1_BH11ARM1_09790 [soil metagenome]